MSGKEMRTFLCTEHKSRSLDWSRFLGRKDELLQATSRSRSHGAL